MGRQGLCIVCGGRGDGQMPNSLGVDHLVFVVFCVAYISAWGVVHRDLRVPAS